LHQVGGCFQITGNDLIDCALAAGLWFIARQVKDAAGVGRQKFP
jgi:hypothetical protein